MPNWLLGQVLAPFFVLLLSWSVTRPASRLVARRMRDGLVKRWLLAERDGEDRASRRRYAIGCAVLLIGMYGSIVWATWP